MTVTDGGVSTIHAAGRYARYTLAVKNLRGRNENS